MTPTNKVTSVISKPYEHRDTVVGITLGDGSNFDAVIDLEMAQILVEILQWRLLRWAYKSAKNLRLPEVQVIDVDVAHQGPAAQLMVTTSQIGVVVSAMSDDVLRKARQRIDRVLTFRSGPKTKQ